MRSALWEDQMTSTKLTRSAWRGVDRVDTRLIPFLRTAAIPMLRISLGVVFVWFGALKVLDVSPVSDLVARTVYWVDPDLAVPALGTFEMFVGLMLLLGRAMRLTLLLFVAQMAGTFVTFLRPPRRQVPMVEERCGYACWEVLAGIPRGSTFRPKVGR
jgi:uncharacterized membrane protein YphA (DoxX/SURF4 family)